MNERAVRDGVDGRAMVDLSLGHLAADFAQGAVPALLVFLKPALGLTYTMTAAVVLVATVTSSVVQPLFGHWSDRRGTSWLMPAGVVLAAAGLALAAISTDYALLLVLIGVSGLGVGAFHPEAMKVAAHASSRRRASAMALFATGGNVGFALGPLVANAALSPLGPRGGLLLLVPGLAVGALLLREQRHLVAVRAEPVHETAQPGGADRRRAFRVLLALIGIRSVAYYGLFTFVPLWEVSRGHTKSYGNNLLFLLLLAGVVGTLAAGPLADRLGRRLVVVTSFLLAPGLIAVYVEVGGILGAVAVCAAGAAIVSTFGVTIVLSQEYLPSRVAMASGLGVGLASGLGGIAAVVLGVVADAVDLRTALLVSAAAPLVGAAVSLLLPPDRELHGKPALAEAS